MPGLGLSHPCSGHWSPADLKHEPDRGRCLSDRLATSPCSSASTGWVRSPAICSLLLLSRDHGWAYHFA